MQKREIIDRKFSRAFQGYDIAEVDFFLDELYREFSLMENEIASLKERVEELSAELPENGLLLDEGREGAQSDLLNGESEEACFIQEEAVFFTETDDLQE